MVSFERRAVQMYKHIYESIIVGLNISVFADVWEC